MAIAHDVSWANTFTGAATTITLASHTPAAGATMVGVAFIQNPTGFGTTDSSGAIITATPYGTTGGFSNYSVYLLTEFNVTATARTVSVNWGTTGRGILIMDSFTGLAASHPFDPASSGTNATGNSQSPASGTTTTTAFPNELLYGIFQLDANQSATAWNAATFNGVAQTGGLGNLTTADFAFDAGYKIVSATGAYQAQGSFTGAANTWYSAIFSFADTNVGGQFQGQQIYILP
jgi:hypothetical protein